MNWKLIEQKPLKWELLQKIIRKCDNQSVSFEIETTDWETDVLIVTSFCQKMENDLLVCKQRWNQVMTTMSVSKPILKRAEKKNVKQKPSSRKYEIQAQVFLKQLAKEWNVYRLDMYTGYPIRNIHFTYRVSFLGLLIWWCFNYAKTTWKTSPLVVIDMYLSLEHAHSHVMEQYEKTSSDTLRMWLFLLKDTMSYVEECCVDFKEKGIELLFQHPRLMISCFYTEHQGKVGLYPEQMEFINVILDAILFDHPLLLGDQRPPGTGKTFMATPLAQKLRSLDRKKILLFSCPNELVRMDVARNVLLADYLQLWIGRKAYMEEEDSSEGFFIRPHKSCFPAKWKDVYRTNDVEKRGTLYQQFEYYTQCTRQWPHVIVADLDTCHQLLQIPELASNWILMLDEVVFDDEKKQQDIISIMKVCPRHTIFTSSILPQWEHVPDFLTYFTNRHDATREHIQRIEANHHVSISCTVIDQYGKLRLPFHDVPLQDLPKLCKKMSQDPLLGRLFPPKYIFDMIQKNTPFDQSSSLHWNQYFPQLKDINHRRVREYILDVLHHMVDGTWKDEKSRESFYQYCQSYRPQVADPCRCDEHLLTKCIRNIDGKTLCVIENKTFVPTLIDMTRDFLQNVPSIHELMEKQDKLILAKEQLLKRLDQKKKVIDIKDIQNERQELSEMDTSFQWPSRYVLSSKTYYHHIGIPRQKGMPDICPLNISREMMETFPEMVTQLVLGGIGVFESNFLTSHQLYKMMSLFSDLRLLFSGNELVFGTNIDSLTHLFISKSFGDSASRDVLYQLIGRVGRMGHSYEARVMTTSDICLQRIFDWHHEVEKGYRHSLNDCFISST